MLEHLLDKLVTTHVRAATLAVVVRCAAPLSVSAALAAAAAAVVRRLEALDQRLHRVPVDGPEILVGHGVALVVRVSVDARVCVEAARREKLYTGGVGSACSST